MRGEFNQKLIAQEDEIARCKAQLSKSSQSSRGLESELESARREVEESAESQRDLADRLEAAVRSPAALCKQRICSVVFYRVLLCSTRVSSRLVASPPFVYIDMIVYIALASLVRMHNTLPI
jgi:hypothetical protein